MIQKIENYGNKFENRFFRINKIDKLLVKVIRRKMSEIINI